jgi:integrase
MLDAATTMITDAERGGRASGKEIMARPRDQDGSLVVRGKRKKMWVLRWRENVLQLDGTVRRIQRAETLGPVSKINKKKASATLQARVATASQGQRRPQATMTLTDFVRVEWRPNAELALKKSSVRYYGFQLDRYISPALGSSSLCDLSRAQIEACLSNLRQKGHAAATLRGVRAALSTVLRTAVEQGYLEKNPAHGIRIRETNAKPPRRFYSPVQVRQLLTELAEPCRTVVLLAVLSGMRIGEILALRWKRVDMLHGTIEIAETFSDGQFGSPKTRSSNRVIPMSSTLRNVLKAYRVSAGLTAPDDLVLCTPKGTPLNSKNLYNRALAPACDRIKQPRVSWHSFRHTHATQLAESGESLKTAQALLGHSDLETTLNTYMHVIPDSQRRAVDRVAGVLFSDVLKLDPDSNEPGGINYRGYCQLRRISGEPRRT